MATSLTLNQSISMDKDSTSLVLQKINQYYAKISSFEHGVRHIAANQTIELITGAKFVSLKVYPEGKFVEVKINDYTSPGIKASVLTLVGDTELNIQITNPSSEDIVYVDFVWAS